MCLSDFATIVNCRLEIDWDFTRSFSMLPDHINPKTCTIFWTNASDNCHTVLRFTNFKNRQILSAFQDDHFKNTITICESLIIKQLATNNWDILTGLTRKDLQIHVWYMYLHLVHFYGKCRWIDSYGWWRLFQYFAISMPFHTIFLELEVYPLVN